MAAERAGGLLAGGKLPKVDYKEMLKPEEFEVFSPVARLAQGLAEKEATEANGAQESE